MKRLLFTICLVTFVLPAFGQLEVTPLFPGNNDSLFLKNLVSFNTDSAGNYSMVYKYIIKDRGIVYELKRVYTSGNGQYTLSDTFNYYKEDDQLQIFADPANKKYHCKFKNNNYVFGPYEPILKIRYSPSSTNIAVTTEDNNVMKLYINNMQKGVIDSPDTHPFPYADWCTFSANGNVLYYIPSGVKYTLYLNNKPINSSDKPFRAISVNNTGKYAYVKETLNNQYLVTPDTTIGPFNKNKGAEDPYGYIQNSGNYSYTIEDTAGAYMIINGCVHRTDDGDNKLSAHGHIVCSYKDDSAYKKNTFKSKSDEFYGFRNRYRDCDLTMRNYRNTVETDAQININVDGKTIRTQYDKIYALGINNEGQPYFCGRRAYYVYRNINGKELPEPITKYGVRPRIFSMTSKGSTVHSFTTDDSEYLYHDEELLYKCAKGKPGIFYVAGYNLVTKSDERPKNLYGLATDTCMYIVYNGAFSKPAGKTIAVGNLVYGTIEDPVTGVKAFSKEKVIDPQIIKSGGDGSNFFFIQKMTNNKYVLLYNNKIIATLTRDELGDISSAVSNEYYIDKQQLVFYGVKNGRVCRYNAKL